LALTGALLALVFWLSSVNPWFYIQFPLATLCLFIGVVTAAVVLIRVQVANNRRAALTVAVESAREEERLARRRFLRRLDHEVKNPVTAIRTALVEEELDAGALAVARTQAARLGRLVSELSKLTDLETRPLDFVEVDLEDITAEAVAASLHDDKEIRVEFPKVPWPVPPVFGDPDLLLVAVFNLISNSAKYSDPGARIEVRASENDGYVTLEVSDTGWGIASEDIDSAWDELARGTNTRGVEGTGLGLSIVRVIAERHNAVVSLNSVPGQGTRVSLKFPALSREDHG
jgi:two-component system OmpR family sensor kinase